MSDKQNQQNEIKPNQVNTYYNECVICWNKTRNYVTDKNYDDVGFECCNDCADRVKASRHLN